ncbi:MAG TPA: ATP-binding cassette domain-containing protein [Microbacterium sp.]|uniref:ATP-binding cassette domain-containing protein n=1 Tax=Microbacterium sp. TaxID=51671 RepID=UPI002B47BE0E|nr:ATP-binding cassette domain-containing protein [Microbacterium sp.]HKT55798.1 ATP-binding cassette domain-containing protein [Microbacterium sp.]
MARIAAADVAIRCTDLSIAHTSAGRTTRVVEGVSFELAFGGALAVLGPVGSGKSTLAATLAGVESSAIVSGGEARVAGIRVQRAARARRRLTFVTGYVGQTSGASLPPRTTVAEIVADPLLSRRQRVNRRAVSVRVAGLLDELGLALGVADRLPYELSAGMRQRVALARALMLDAQVLIADEPFAGVDATARPLVHAALARRRAAGLACLMIMSDRAAIAEMDADVLVLHEGHAVAYGHGTEHLLWSPSADRGVIAS